MPSWTFCCLHAFLSAFVGKVPQTVTWFVNATSHLSFSIASSAGEYGTHGDEGGGGDDDDGDACMDDAAETYFNNLAIFGLPGDAGGAATRRGSMYDTRAELIVSPVLNRKRWGEEDAGPDAKRGAGPDALDEDG